MHLPGESRDDELLDELLERLEDLGTRWPDASFDELLAKEAGLARRLDANSALRGMLAAQFAALRQITGVIDPANKANRYQPQLPGFEIIEILGHGGVGVVYRARQVSLSRDVALKVMLGGRFASQRTHIRFQHEAEVAASLQHPHIAQIFDHGEHEGVPYLVQELVSGGSLAERISRRELTPRAAARLVEILARATHFAHQHGVIHRDLKPANVLMTETDEPKIVDFGLAKALEFEGGLTRPGEAPGTPSYMAPEQIKGDNIGPHTDVYALGAILYELLVDKPPFDGRSSAEVYTQILDGPPRMPKEVARRVPPELAAIAFKSLEQDPRRRYISANELADDLERYLTDKPVRARPPGPVERVFKWVRRRPAAAALVAVSIGSALALTATVVGYTSRLQDALAEARSQRGHADQRRLMAEASERRVRQFQYAADITLADQALQSANVLQAVNYLSRQVPAAGADDPREYCWHHLWNLCHREERRFDGHAGDVYFVSVSRDGSKLASASADGTVRLWDVGTGSTLAVLRGHEAEVNHVEFSPDGSLLASAGDDGKLRIWSVADRAPRATLTAGADQLFCAVFSPDGSVVATAGLDGMIRLWDVANWTQREEFPGYLEERRPVQALAFSRDGATLIAVADHHAPMFFVLGDKDRHPRTHLSVDNFPALAIAHHVPWIATPLRRDVFVYDVERSDVVINLRGHTGDVSGVAFSPDDTRLATAGNDSTVRIWDWQSGREMQRIVGHLGRVWSVAFLPDGKRIVTSGADKSVRIWNLELLAQRGPPQRFVFPSVRSIATTSTNNLVAIKATDRPAEIWDSHSLRMIKQIEGPEGNEANVVALAPDGKMLALGLPQGGVLLEDLEARRPRVKLPTIGGVTAIAFSPVVGGPLAAGAGREITLWRPDTGADFCTLTAPRDVESLILHPNGRLLVSSSHEFVQLWDIVTRRVVETRQLVGARFGAVALSPDGKLLAAACSDKLVRLFNATTLKPRGELADHHDAVVLVTFHPDGKTLASLDFQGVVKLWHVPTGQALLTFSALSGDGPRLTFTRDGQQLLTGGADSSDGCNLLVW